MKDIAIPSVFLALGAFDTPVCDNCLVLPPSRQAETSDEMALALRIPATA
jgi:hypothetical protein